MSVTVKSALFGSSPFLWREAEDVSHILKRSATLYIDFVREIRTEKAILGRLYLNGAFVCYTLENAAKAVPCGMYSVKNSRSPKFKRELPLLFNAQVPSSRGIRIHRGNTAKDSQGCVLVGMGRSTEKSSVTESANAEIMVTMICRSVDSLVICEE